MKPMNEQELRAATGDALVDAIKKHIKQLQALKMDPELIKVDVAQTFNLDRLGPVGRLVPGGLLNGWDAH